MNGKGWRLSFSVMVMILMIALAIKWMEPPVESGQEEILSELHELDLRAYFPSFLGMTYHFSGEGMEYAGFTRKIAHMEPNFLQIEDLSGTNLAQVVSISADEVRIIWAEEEFYGAKNLLLDKSFVDRSGGSPRDLILLKHPLVKGNTWHDEHFQREIIATDEILIVPFGTFYEVLVVKSTSLSEDGSVMYEYYAKNIGLVKRVSLYVHNGETLAVVSNLRGIAYNPPQF